MFVHLHIPHKPTWGVLLAITVVTLPLGGIEFVRWVEMLEARSLPIVGGRVLQREEVQCWGWIPAARLTLQITNQADTVVAIIPNHTADKLGTSVRLYYSGNSQKRVHLEGEENPLWMILLVWGVPLLLWGIYFGFRRSPRWRASLALD